MVPCGPACEYQSRHDLVDLLEFPLFTEVPGRASRPFSCARFFATARLDRGCRRLRVWKIGWLSGRVWCTVPSMGPMVLGRAERAGAVSLLAAVVVALHGCGSSGAGEGGSESGSEGLVETACRGLAAVECFETHFDECVSTLKESVAAAVALGCQNEADASYRCLGATPNFECDGDAFRYNGNCDQEGQALDNCERSHSDYCTTEWGAGTCQECWCEACPCDETCVADRSAVTACAADCEDEACAEACLQTVGGAFAEYSECANDAAAGGGACASICP